MKINQLPPAIFTLLFIFALACFGQTAPVEKTVLSPSNPISADENFRFNITNERITETNFARSTNVELAGENRGGLRLEVGVGVRAEQINVLLRGIFGQVRFRASLEQIKKRIELTQRDSQKTETDSPQP